MPSDIEDINFIIMEDDFSSANGALSLPARPPSAPTVLLQDATNTHFNSQAWVDDTPSEIDVELVDQTLDVQPLVEQVEQGSPQPLQEPIADSQQVSRSVIIATDQPALGSSVEDSKKVHELRREVELSLEQNRVRLQSPTWVTNPSDGWPEYTGDRSTPPTAHQHRPSAPVLFRHEARRPYAGPTWRSPLQADGRQRDSTDAAPPQLARPPFQHQQQQQRHWHQQPQSLASSQSQAPVFQTPQQEAEYYRGIAIARELGMDLGHLGIQTSNTGPSSTSFAATTPSSLPSRPPAPSPQLPVRPFHPPPPPSSVPPNPYRSSAHRWGNRYRPYPDRRESLAPPSFGEPQADTTSNRRHGPLNRPKRGGRGGGRGN